MRDTTYSLTHAEIMDQREGIELLALSRFFGMSSDQRLWKNQERLSRLSEETLAYEGQAQVVEQEVIQRKTRSHARRVVAAPGLRIHGCSALNESGY